MKPPIFERRSDIKREADYLYTMRIARRRFKVERHLGSHTLGFREWAGRTYNPLATTGKLRAVVSAAVTP